MLWREAGEAQWKLCLQKRRLGCLPQGNHLAQGSHNGQAQGHCLELMADWENGPGHSEAIKPSQLIPSKSSIQRSLELLHGEKCWGKSARHGGFLCPDADAQALGAVHRSVRGTAEGVCTYHTYTCTHTQTWAHTSLPFYFCCHLPFFW